MAGPRNKGPEVDFSGVESGGRSCPDGEYILEVASVPEEKESQNGNAMLNWKWKIAEGDYKGVLIYDNTVLTASSLWRLKALLESIGVDVPSGKMGLDLKSYVGKRCLVEITNETYQGKEKPRITAFLGQRSVAPAGKSSTSDPYKKGVKVTFTYEDQEITAPITGVEGDKLIVAVTIDGSKEEWELDKSEVTLA